MSETTVEKIEKGDNTSWTLSFLSSVAGQVDAAAESEDIKLFSWGTVGKHYWLHYTVDNNGKQAVRLMSFTAPEPAFYSIIGYCKYHKIQIEIDESLPEIECTETTH